MKKAKKIILISFICLAVIAVFLTCFLTKSNKIPNDYVAVFHGGAGELTHSTYIYKIDNGQDNYGFKYINTENITESWGSDKWIIKVTKRGTFDWTDEAFKIAKDNNAYQYVTLPNSDKIYTTEEFANMFIMD